MTYSLWICRHCGAKRFNKEGVCGKCGKQSVKVLQTLRKEALGKKPS